MSVACLASRRRPLSVGGLRRSLGVEVLKFPRFDLALANEGVDLGLLQPDNAAETVRRELAFVDQPVQRSWGEPQRRCGFLGRKPVTVCLCHTNQHNTISTPLGISRTCMPTRPVSPSGWEEQ